jgi:hypothetical protein
MSVGLTMLGRVLSELEQPCTLAIPACCGIVTAGGFPTTSYGVPVVATTFAAAPAVASGLAAVAELNGDPETIICWAGDGGTYDIGLASLSAAAERNEDLLYVCYDNDPLYEVWDGRRYRINVRPDWTGLEGYFERQGRFPASGVDLESIARSCRERFRELSALVEVGHDFPSEASVRWR